MEQFTEKEATQHILLLLFIYLLPIDVRRHMWLNLL